MRDVPEGLVRAVSSREGAAGTAWLGRLPGMIEGLLNAWELRIDGPAMHGEVAVVVPVRQGDVPAVLKVSFPHPGNRSEPGALRAFAGRGAVRLLAAAEGSFALLLERAGPLTLDSVSSPEEAIELAGGLACRLAVPAAPETPSLAESADGWADELHHQVAAMPGALPSTVLDRAHGTIRALAADTTTTMMHGDLHTGNVLAAEREPWLTIDPKGLRGSAAYDAFTAAAAKRETLAASTDPGREFSSRVRRFADAAGVDAGLAMAFVQARATSSLLYERLHGGDRFALGLLEVAARLGTSER